MLMVSILVYISSYIVTYSCKLLHNLIKSIFLVANMLVPPLSSAEMDISMLMEKVNMVFTRLDTNQDGILTQEEFIQGIMF